ncbi:PBAN-type neuropeptides-like [Sitophilus oryzae]|uniref:PBAN-type neuropeptides-like n=1 Tax=Sitophilus oryzae TaxID=7048 RepID=A0A6J2Y019_SITOR|nr:PBAN-type neuropeptides-like [Sitophilus oryzae]
MSNPLVKLSFAVTLLLYFTPSAVSSFDNVIDLNNPKQNPDKISSVWFGSRINQKKSSDKEEDKKIGQLLESLEDYPWTLVAISENNDMEKRSHTHNFTPRLGRNLDDNHLTDDADVVERFAPFPPRLGRRLNMPYSPRLGRDESPAYL